MKILDDLRKWWTQSRSKEEMVDAMVFGCILCPLALFCREESL